VNSEQRKAAIDFPSELEVVVTREFEAPLELVFDVLTKAEHVRKTIAPFGEEVTACSVDLRVGGNYHFAFVPEGGSECSFRGTYLEIEAPTRTVATWLFEGWPGAEAVETMDLRDNHGATRMTWTLAFRDKTGRDHMTKYDGMLANLDHVEDHLTSLLAEGR